MVAKDNLDWMLAQDQHCGAVRKAPRRGTLRAADKPPGRLVRGDSLRLAAKQAVRGGLKGFDPEVRLVSRVVTNQDGSTGRWRLVWRDLTGAGDRVADLPQKRGKVEDSQKSLHSNATLATSPTRTLRTQHNQGFLSSDAGFKRECLKRIHKLNPFALRAKLSVKALQQAFSELTRLKAA